MATIFLQRRGTLKAVLPLIVAAGGNFGAEATAAFGGLEALPDTVPEATLEKVQFHLEETTGGHSLLLFDLIDGPPAGDPSI